MPSSTNLESFRDPAFSLFQSAIHSTLLRHHSLGILKLPFLHRGLGLTADDPHMLAAVNAIHQLQKAPPAAPAEVAMPAATPDQRPAGTFATIEECAKLAAQIAWSELFDHAKVPALKSELTGSTCDLFWAECLVVYEAFLASGNQQPYTVYGDIRDYVLTGLPDTATIAVIGDWGTGTNAALALLQQIAANFHPTVLMHLGDIYYSGLPGEGSSHFTAIIQEAWPQNPPLVFTLDGNHDRYAGAGGGYYPLIAGLNPGTAFRQPNSYFALRNNFWQFLAMDTGYHDTDPFTVNTNLTYLEQTEIDWHLDKLDNNGLGVDATVNRSGARGTIALSHHQLISAAGVGNNPQGQPLAVNPNLANPFASVLNLIDFWFWGHEHDLCIFEPYTAGPDRPLPPGRCVGASAVPIFTTQQTAPPNLVLPPSEPAPPAIVPGTGLGNNGNVLNHAYAIIKLANAALSIDYYQFDSTDNSAQTPPTLVYSEQVASPRVSKPLTGAAGGPI